jgi:hypothetical protein
MLTKQLTDLPAVLKLAFVASIGLLAFDLVMLVSIVLSGSAKIDSGIATLCGAVIGLSVVAWQTGKGFQNLIQSQENQARIEREGRLHRAELDELAAARKLTHDREVLLGALRAEIVYLFGEAITAERHVRGLLKMQNFLKDRGSPALIKELGLRTFDAPVFKANIHNLGLLGAHLGADIIKVLSRANGKETKITHDQPIPHDTVVYIYEGNMDWLRKWASDLHHVGLRLLAAENQTADLGTLAETQKERYKRVDD